MPSSRLLSIALFLWPALLFAQGNRTPNSSPTPEKPPGITIADFRTPAAKPSEPWRIFPQSPEFEAKNFVIAPDGPGDIVPEGLGDTTCYSIRSYVVARDSKDSEATHPAGYSTCRPARRYGLKKVTITPSPAKR